MKLRPFWDAVASPVPVTVTCAVEFAVDPPGLYRTLMVQLPPGLTTKPFTQVPPVIVKVAAAGPAVLVTVGFAVNVNGPALAPCPLEVLTTLIVPFLVLVPPVFSNGDGCEIVSVAPVTLNCTVLL